MIVLLVRACCSSGTHIHNCKTAAKSMHCILFPYFAASLPFSSPQISASFRAGAGPRRTYCKDGNFSMGKKLFSFAPSSLPIWPSPAGYSMLIYGTAAFVEALGKDWIGSSVLLIYRTSIANNKSQRLVSEELTFISNWENRLWTKEGDKDRKDAEEMKVYQCN